MLTSYDTKRLKKQARRALVNDWAGHIIAYMLSVVCFTGISYIGYAMYDLMVQLKVFSNAAVFFPGLYITLATVILSPVVYGIFHYECQYAKYGKASPREVFAAFSSSESLLDAYALLWKFVLYVLPGALPALALRYFIVNVYPGYGFYPKMLFGIDVTYLCLNIVFLIFTAMALVCSARRIVGLYFAVKLKDNGDAESAFVMARVATHGNSYQIYLLGASFIPVFVLSLFTFGFLFVAYALPLFVMTLVRVSDELYERTYENKSTDKVYDQLFNTYYSYEDKTELTFNVETELQDKTDYSEQIPHRDRFVLPDVEQTSSQPKDFCDFEED